MNTQRVLTASPHYTELDFCFNEMGVRKILLVCGGSFNNLRISKFFNILTERTGIECVRFSNFHPNPDYESVVAGLRLFHSFGADMIVAVGGGSAIDVAKCIKLYSNMSPDICYIQQPIVPNDIPLLAVPTTAGTGSEVTKYAVIYYDGIKQSITDNSIMPSIVLMDASALKTLSIYHKKVTMLDAMCHAIESYWSIHSTEESKDYSRQAIQLISDNRLAYLNNDEQGNANMLLASYIAGKAINITQTTAGHAMSYKLTSLYGISHGYAVALCLSKLWPYMLANIDKCIDPRGEEYLNNTFSDIASAMGCTSSIDAANTFQVILDEMKLVKPFPKEEEFELLKLSVNPIRLKNHPIQLEIENINKLYHKILQ